MTDYFKEILPLLTAVLGGSLVAVINVYANRKKTAADAAASNINDALRLKEVAMEQFNTTAEKLERAQELLEEVKKENERLYNYIEELQKILDDHGIPYEKFNK